MEDILFESRITKGDWGDDREPRQVRRIGKNDQALYSVKYP